MRQQIIRDVWCMLLFVCQFVVTQAQSIVSAVMPKVSLYADRGYMQPTDLSNMRMAVYDARHENDEPLYYLRRYYDDVYLAHPSVLANRRTPSYFVVLASNVTELESASKLILSNKRRSSTAVVLLYSGSVEDLAAVSLDIYNAVYVCSGDCEGIKSPVDPLSQAFFGGIALSVPTDYLTLGNGNLVGRDQQKTRLAYAQPETVGMNSSVLSEIDGIAKQMISDQASPGCYVLVAHKGTVVWSKPYGNSAYKDGHEVAWDNLYDIASVSKAFGTLPIVMHMFDEGKLAKEQLLGDFLPEVDSLKAQIAISELLLHQSGLGAGVAIYQLCVDSASFEAPLYSYRRKGRYTVRIENRLYMSNTAHVKVGLFADKHSEKYPVQVSSNVYTSDSLRMAVLDYIDNSRLLKKTYRYSDLNFIYLQQIAERVYNRPLDQLFNMFIARPLGLRRMLYRPLEKYDRNEIIPTENDQYLRGEQIWGTVHDQTAALIGGVAGNAGLFASANELAKVAQMYLWRGTYGGVELINSSTVGEFTKRHSDKNRRGFGFDKPELSGGGPVCDQASQSSFGHSGFSGTLAWVDPEYDLVYIFLSNRICPNAYNNKLTTTSVRSKIHEVIYKSFMDR